MYQLMKFLMNVYFFLLKNKEIGTNLQHRGTRKQNVLILGAKKDKKKRFNPKTLHTYDKVLVRENYPTENWQAAYFSHLEYDVSKYYLDVSEETPEFIICTTGSCVFCYCIPYNDETKHLVGTTEEAPEYYRYWED